MSDPAFIYVIYIRAPRERVWAALTDPKQTVKYWFDTAIESDWKTGSAFAFHRNGKIDVTGEILETDPPSRLVFSFLHDPQYPDSHAEGASRVVYDLADDNGQTRLTVTHDQFPDASVVRPGIAGGWPAILSGLKSLLETT